MKVRRVLTVFRIIAILAILSSFIPKDNNDDNQSNRTEQVASISEEELTESIDQDELNAKKGIDRNSFEFALVRVKPPVFCKDNLAFSKNCP